MGRIPEPDDMLRSKSMRLFVAVMVPEAIRGRLAGLAWGLSGVRWVPEPNYHITLRFIGEVGRNAANEIADALCEVGGEAFDVRLEGLGCFGGNRPRLIYAAPEPAGPLRRLRARVNRALAGLVVESASRKYTPHVTLARLRQAASASAVAAYIGDRGGFRTEQWRVGGFSLVSSVLGGEASVYTEEVRFPFGAEAFAP